MVGSGLWAVILRQWRVLHPPQRFLKRVPRDSWALSSMAGKMETAGQDMTAFFGSSALGIQNAEPESANGYLR